MSALDRILSTPYAADYFGGASKLRERWAAAAPDVRRSLAERFSGPPLTDKQMQLLLKLHYDLGKVHERGGNAALRAYFGLYGRKAASETITALRTEAGYDERPASRDQLLFLAELERRAGIALTPYDVLNRLSFADADGRIQLLKREAQDKRDRPSATVTSFDEFRARRSA